MFVTGSEGVNSVMRVFMAQTDRSAFPYYRYKGSHSSHIFFLAKKAFFRQNNTNPDPNPNPNPNPNPYPNPIWNGMSSIFFSKIENILLARFVQIFLVDSSELNVSM